MKTKKALNNTIDYLVDDDFINHVINGAPFMEKFCKGEAYEEAKRILLAPDDVDVDFGFPELVELKNRIFNTLGLALGA